QVSVGAWSPDHAPAADRRSPPTETQRATAGFGLLGIRGRPAVGSRGTVRRPFHNEDPPLLPTMRGPPSMKTLEVSVLDRLLDPLGQILTPEVARKLINLRVDATAQARIDKLARRCNEGKLTDSERREYETYVYAIDFIAILQAKARALL